MNIPREFTSNDLKRTLGEGTFGKVHLIQKDGCCIAFKAFRQIRENHMERLEKESSILEALNHRNIIEFLGLGTLKKRDGSIQRGIIMEYCEKGRLRNVIDNPRLIYSIEAMIRWSEQAFNALAYLREKGKNHCDIKPENILLTKDYSIRIGDLGSTKELINTLTGTIVDVSPIYSPPEWNNNRILSPTYDVYSMGLVMWEMIERVVVFDRYRKKFGVESIDYEKGKELQDLEPFHCIERLHQIIRKCTIFDHQKRLSSSKALIELQYLKRLYESNRVSMIDILEEENQRDLIRPIGFDGGRDRVLVIKEYSSQSNASIEDDQDGDWTITPPRATMSTSQSKIDDNQVESEEGTSIISLLPQISNQSYLEDLKKLIKLEKKPIRSVNLAEWLVLENGFQQESPAWRGIPDEIKEKGEYHLMKYLGHQKGDKLMEEHRQTMITERDFEEISGLGLNTVRIPVGYWILEFDDTWGDGINDWKVFAPGALRYLDKAIKEWALKYRLLVLISFNAAKGSQNGFVHSAPTNLGRGDWSGYDENITHSLNVIEKLVERYKDQPSFLGIAPLHGPRDQDSQRLRQYYYDCWGRIRNDLKSDCLLIISPLLHEQDGSLWMEHMTEAEHRQNVRLEWYKYYVWDMDGKDFEQIINGVREVRSTIRAWKGNPLIIGEWCLDSSCEMDDDQLRQFAQEQLISWRQASGGWSFNTWKFYGEEENELRPNTWSLKSMIKHGIIDPNQF